MCGVTIRDLAHLCTRIRWSRIVEIPIKIPIKNRLFDIIVISYRYRRQDYLRRVHVTGKTTVTPCKNPDLHRTLMIEGISTELGVEWSPKLQFMKTIKLRRE